ncbi:MAG: hypothetical protein P3W96_006350 [Halomonas sp.]|nr:hypothetical protein [Halomonas sp.]MDM7481623.1 hypothetical protein [Halomonas sp.]
MSTENTVFVNKGGNAQSTRVAGAKTAKPSPVVKMAVVGIVFLGLFYANQYSAQLVHNISNLPVHGVALNQPQETAAPPRQETLYPLLAESTRKANELRQAAGNDLIDWDRLFGQVSRSAAAKPAPEPTQPAPAPPVLDAFPLLRAGAQLQALTPQGAVINDEYVEVGQPVTSLAYPSTDGQRMLYPTLAAKGADWVELKEAAGKRRIRLHLL